MAETDETTILTVTSRAASLLEAAIAAGDYASPSELIEEVFAGPDDHLLGYTAEEMDRLIDEGIASGPGQPLDFEDVKREARRRSGASLSKV